MLRSRSQHHAVVRGSCSAAVVRKPFQCVPSSVERAGARCLQHPAQALLVCSSGELGRKRKAVDAAASMAAMLNMTAW